MVNSEFKRLINKYALILIIVYGIRFLSEIILQQFSPETLGLNKDIHSLLFNSLWMFQFFMNIIVTLFIISDSKKFKIKNNLLIIATLIFSIVGVSLFLLLANRVIKSK